MELTKSKHIKIPLLLYIFTTGIEGVDETSPLDSLIILHTSAGSNIV